MRSVLPWLLLATLVASTWAATAEAKTCTWTRATASGWTDTGGWSGCAGGTGYPVSGDHVVFDTADGQCNLFIDVTVASITINSGYDGEIVTNPARTLTVTGNFSQASGQFNGDIAMYPVTSVSIGGDLTLTGDAEFFAPPTTTVTGSVSMATGTTFTGHTSASAVATLGAFTLTAGTFTPSTATTVTGAFLQSGGTFTGHSTGSLDFDSTVTLNGGTFSASRHTNVDGAFAVGGGAFTGSSTGLLKVVGNFSITSGTFTPSASNFLTGSYSQSGGTFTGGTTNFVVGTDFSASSTSTFTAPWYLSVGGNFSRSNTTFTQGSNNVLLTSAASPTHSFGGVTLNNLVLTDAASLSSGLLAHWKFEETSTTGTTAADQLGVTTLTHAAGAPAPDYRLAPIRTTNARSRDFVATQNAEKTSYSGTLDNDEWTLAAWFSAEVIDTGGGCGALDNGSEIISVGNNYLLRLCQETANTVLGSVHFRRATDNASIKCVSTNSVTYNDGSWHHIAGTNDGVKLTIYLDGVPTVCADHNADTDSGDAMNLNLRVGGHPTSASFDYDGRIDEVRVYNRALTYAEVLRLWAGASETAGAAVHTASGNLTVSNLFRVGSAGFTLGAGTATFTSGGTIVSGGTLTTAAGAVSLGNTFTVDGTLTIGAGTTTAAQALTINAGGTLSLTSSSSILKITSGKVLTIDGTLSASTASAVPTISADSAANSFAFRVGSSATATPVLNIDGLNVQDTDLQGMEINQAAGVSTGSTTTFTKFDNIAFSSGTAGSSYLLQITAASLSLFANGLTFDTSTTKTFRLADTAAGSDVKAFVGATCNSSEAACEATDEDADSDEDGVPTAGGAVIQWGHRGWSDVPGTIEGIPSPAFDWGTFAFNATYVVYNNGASDTLYARDTDGKAAFSWTLPSAATEAFKGPPRWIQSGGIFYVYVISDKGNVYKVQHVTGGAAGLPGDSFLQVGTYQHNSPSATATATSALLADASNLYWAGNSGAAGSTPLIFGITQAMASIGSQSVVAINALSSVDGSYLFGATVGKFYKIPIANMGTPITSTTVTPAYAVDGRITAYANRAYFVDNGGKLWVVDTSHATNPPVAWTYQDTAIGAGHHAVTACPTNANCVAKNLFVDVNTGRVYFGDKDGHVYAVYNSAGSTGAVIYNNYPVQPSTFTGEFQTAPLYRDGVIVIGTTTGMVYFIDQYNGTNSGGVYRTFNFGSAVSTISYDRNSSTTGEYVIGTADGKLYYVSAVTVPDPSDTHK